MFTLESWECATDHVIHAPPSLSLNLSMMKLPVKQIDGAIKFDGEHYMGISKN